MTSPIFLILTVIFLIRLTNWICGILFIPVKKARKMIRMITVKKKYQGATIKNKLTYIQGYKSMFFFLRGYFKKTRVGDVASLLGDTMFCEEDGEEELNTSDPASWYDWVDSIYKTFPLLKGTSEKNLTYFQAFKVMYTFLYDYEIATSYEDVADILKELFPISTSNESDVSDSVVWKRWLHNIQKAMQAKSSAD